MYCGREVVLSCRAGQSLLRKSIFVEGWLLPHESMSMEGLSLPRVSMSVSGEGGTVVMDMCCVAGQSLPVRLSIKAVIVVIVGDLDVSFGLAGCVGGLGFCRLCFFCRGDNVMGCDLG
jgi:hypothetical protein